MGRGRERGKERERKGKSPGKTYTGETWVGKDGIGKWNQRDHSIEMDGCGYGCGCNHQMKMEDTTEGENCQSKEQREKLEMATR
jgi:hypothetical protein